MHTGIAGGTCLQPPSTLITEHSRPLRRQDLFLSVTLPVSITFLTQPFIVFILKNDFTCLYHLCIAITDCRTYYLADLCPILNTKDKWHGISIEMLVKE